MRAVIVFSTVTLIQGVLGYVHGGAFPAIPAVMRRADIFNGGSLVKRQEVCDADAELSCRVGEYCVIIDGAVGCCPEGKVCGSVRTCVDYSTPGCKNRKTVGGALCCDADTPYCKSMDSTDYCDTVPPPPPITKTVPPPPPITKTVPPPPPVTKTVAVDPTVYPDSNYITTTVAPSYPSDETTSDSLPSLTPYPSDEAPEAMTTPTDRVDTNVSTSVPTVYHNTTTSVPKPTAPPIQTGAGVTITVSFSVIIGGFALALLGGF